jgi:hypothetical protein
MVTYLSEHVVLEGRVRHHHRCAPALCVSISAILSDKITIIPIRLFSFSYAYNIIKEV